MNNKNYKKLISINEELKRFKNITYIWLSSSIWLSIYKVLNNHEGLKLHWLSIVTILIILIICINWSTNTKIIAENIRKYKKNIKKRKNEIHFEIEQNIYTAIQKLDENWYIDLANQDIINKTLDDILSWKITIKELEDQVDITQSILVMKKEYLENELSKLS